MLDSRRWRCGHGARGQPPGECSTATHCITLQHTTTNCNTLQSGALQSIPVVCACYFLRSSALIYYDKLHAKTAALSCLVAPAFDGQAYTERCWSIWGRQFRRGDSLTDPRRFYACEEQLTRAISADWGAPLAASPLPSPPLSTFNHGKHPLIWGWFQMLIIYMYCCIYKYMHSSLQLD